MYVLINMFFWDDEINKSNNEIYLQCDLQALSWYLHIFVCQDLDEKNNKNDLFSNIWIDSLDQW